MTPNDSCNNEGVHPRFEFRLFGKDFSRVADRMNFMSDPVPERIRERRSDEIYIVSPNTDINNVKIRHGLMDIKGLLRTVDGLEQWGPLMKAEFPVDAQLLLDEVCPALHVSIAELNKSQYSMDDFLELLTTTGHCQAVNVSKHRHGYMINDTVCEMAKVTINGVEVETIATESSDIEAVKDTIADLGLTGKDNMNYLQGIKRVIGMVDKPLAN